MTDIDASPYQEFAREAPKRVYVAGPMTGLPQFNFPAFDAAAADLRARGYEVVTPSELDSEPTRAAALASPHGDPTQYVKDTGDTWGDLLARDVKLIADEGIEAIVVLPGWGASRGARLETFVGRLCGLPVYHYKEGEPLHRVSDHVLAFVHGGMHAANAESHSGEVRVVNEQTGGAKGSKPQRMELLPWDALLAVSEVYGFGAQKYEPNNWRRGYDWSLSFGALQRHLAAFWMREDADPESGLSHLAHAAFHVLTLLVFTSAHGALDDRPR